MGLSQKHRELILAFRESILERYQWSKLKDREDIPETFNAEKTEKIKNYFLEYIYPLPEKREELNAAFSNLEGYISQPQKLMHLVLNSSSLVFKFGRHLPKMLQAGIKALQSFTTASRFEQSLVQVAENTNAAAPLNAASIPILISSLPQKQVISFVYANEKLFDTLRDRKLVLKIKQILTVLIEKMRSRPDIYDDSDIAGLEIGLDIITQGDDLFGTLEKEEQDKIFAFIVELERAFLEQCHRR